jgi:hypothetical protein
LVNELYKRKVLGGFIFLDKLPSSKLFTYKKGVSGNEVIIATPLSFFKAFSEKQTEILGK